MNKLSKWTAIFCLLISSSASHAVVVDIFLDGLLVDLTGGSDNYGIDGASAQFSVIYDTASPNVGTGILPGFGSYATYDAISAEISIDGETIVLDPSGFLSVSNNYISGGTDTLSTAAPQSLTGSLIGLIMSDFVFELGAGFFAGAIDPTLPVLSNSDIISVFTPIIEEDFTFEPQYQFDLIGVSITSTAIPLPAAVWLFGSAIAGLAGFRAKRV